MLILKEGKFPNRAKNFICIHCGTVFKAEYGEYQNASQLEYMHDGVINRCQCPICKKITFNGVDM